MDSLRAATQKRNSQSLMFDNQVYHRPSNNIHTETDQPVMPTQCLCGSQGAGSGVLVGLRVAGG